MSITLDIQQPQPFDLVGASILISGNATAFEGTLSVRVSEGHDEFTGFITVGSLGLRQFQGQFDIPASNAFQLSRLFLTVADDTGNESGPSVVIPVLFGPMILPGYTGWQPFTVQPGDTLTAIAQSQYGTGDFQPIFAANQHILNDPNVIFPGQVLRIPRNDI
ncbi:LysM peptidoglycan-binding domain-containing protein [Primorskyibacter aestuariivivens]|uniref:LysM peptidoglycan-binding domain-containing protein n=1 Tax=Primorskyibacter aestuariivivens TaxID=1888912 RepID=UPI0022FFCF07|nr:LysM peptidoglycan-binding domain-containing protein [Primorskyibacter aestuariivivens]MDA7426859.1 LysM peptidoglycan-binding domain-containing protein [Primorskyibacter aestuariivivens]